MIVATSHMITTIPRSWEAIFGFGTFAARVQAQIWVDSMAICTVRLAFVTKLAGR